MAVQLVFKSLKLFFALQNKNPAYKLSMEPKEDGFFNITLARGDLTSDFLLQAKDDLRAQFRRVGGYSVEITPYPDLLWPGQTSDLLTKVFCVGGIGYSRGDRLIKLAGDSWKIGGFMRDCLLEDNFSAHYQ